MSNEITTETLAKAIDSTKETVQLNSDTVVLEIQEKQKILESSTKPPHPIQPTKCHVHRAFR